MSVLQPIIVTTPLSILVSRVRDDLINYDLILQRRSLNKATIEHKLHMYKVVALLVNLRNSDCKVTLRCIHSSTFRCLSFHPPKPTFQHAAPITRIWINLALWPTARNQRSSRSSGGDPAKLRLELAGNCEGLFSGKPLWSFQYICIIIGLSFFGVANFK